MKSKILIVSTIKDSRKPGYYVNEKERFWGLIHKTGLTKNILNPEQHKEFTEQTGIEFAELATSEFVGNSIFLKRNISKLEVSISHFVERLKEILPTTIVFNGKTSAGWFFQYLYEHHIDRFPGNYLSKIIEDFSYGKQPLKYIDTDIYILPNTSCHNRSWNEQEWINLWLMIKNNKI